MFDQSDPSILWVSATAAKDGIGTFESPFADIERALAVIKPGNTLVLRAGKYRRNATIQVSGTLRQPIRICGEEGAEVHGACWFLYDVSNVIISRIAFCGAPQGAISVIGACSHNRFAELTFLDCGVGEKTSCTLFFGGSGGSCNVVENCRFERRAGVAGAESAIALMVAEGDADHGQPIVNHVFRKNTMVNYTTGIVVGAGDAPSGQYGHVVEYNILEGCRGDGMIIKCGDTQARGNLIRQCAGTALSIRAGTNSVIEANRIMDSASGIGVCGSGHSIENNCFIRCGNQGIFASGDSSGNPATGLFIENNTFVACGGPGDHAAIRVESGASGILRKNLFDGHADITGPMHSFMVVKNASTRQAAEGIEHTEVLFSNPAGDDYSNDSGFGAAGWALTSLAFDPHADDVDPQNDYRAVDFDEDMDSENPVAEAASFEAFMGQFYLDDAANTDDERWR